MSRSVELFLFDLAEAAERALTHVAGHTLASISADRVYWLCGPGERDFSGASAKVSAAKAALFGGGGEIAAAKANQGLRAATFLPAAGPLAEKITFARPANEV